MSMNYMRTVKALLILAVLIVPILQLNLLKVSIASVHSINQMYELDKVDDNTTRTPIFPSIDQKMIINTTRSIKISEYSLVSLNDSVLIKNLDEREFNSILVYYEKSLFYRLINLRVSGFWVDKNKFVESQIVIYAETNEYIALALILNRVISKDDTYRISIQAELDGIISFTEYEDTLRFYLNITRDILIPLPINESITEVFPPLYSEIIDTLMEPREGFGVQGNKVFWKTSGLAPFNESIKVSDLTKISYVYRLKDPIQLPLKVLFAKRVITISADGGVEVTDVIRVTVFSPEKFVSIETSKWKTQGIVIGLAGKVDQDLIEARDRFGALKIAEETTLERDRLENYTFIRVTFRNPLVGGESYEISISYPLKDKSSISRNGDEFEIHIPPMPIINATINVFKFVINSMYDVSIDSDDNALLNPVYFKHTRVKGFFLITSYERVEFTYSRICTSANKVMKLEFTLNPAVIFGAFVAIFEYLFVIVASMILIARIMGRRKLAIKFEEAPKYRVLRENLIKFIANYEEYLSIEDEIITELREKAVNKRPVSKVAQSLTAKLEELRRKKSVVYDYSEKIKDDPDIVPLIDKLAELDTRTDLIRRKIFDDLNRYLRGRMKRSEFVREAELSLGELLRNIKGKRRILNSLRDVLIVKYSKAT